MLKRTIALELAPYRITVNNIAPVAVETPMDGPSKSTPTRWRNCSKRYRSVEWPSQKR